MSVTPVYEGWAKCQAQLVNRLKKLGPQEVQLKASPDGWPIWAIVGHLAGARVYWLCGVFKEAGAETTAFPDPLGEGWEDRLGVPRSPEELLFAVESSWRIVESSLERWTPEMLGETFSRERAGELQLHSRHSVLTRLVMHDAFHCGETSIILGMRGLPSMDPWEPPS
ncbi:MAG: DinB family protein [Candidatus Dormibacteraeota bacterium]|nr:DinB family protein [Candidatus Dormibacteraeota bacterium]